MRAGTATATAPSACTDCGLTACDGLEVVWSAEHHAPLCGSCHGRRAPKTGVDSDSGSTETDSDHVSPLRNDPITPVVAGSPSSSSLVPSFTRGEETEVEWLLRQHEAGKIDPVSVELPSLPTSATQPMREVARFFTVVHGLRLWAGDDRDVLFGCEWVAGKTGLKKITVWRALNALTACEVLKLTGKLPGRDKRGTHLYAPGNPPGRDSGKGLRAIDGGRADTCRCDPARHNTYLDEDGDRRCCDCSKRRSEVSQ